MTTRARVNLTMNANDKAPTLLDRKSRITLSQRDFVTLSRALDGAFKPNHALKSALADARAKVRHA